jgi:glycosyltransferase involved in cell wall biosynthesis
MEQVKKLKVVWICHFSNAEIRKRLPLKKRSIDYYIRSVLNRSHKKNQQADFAPWVSNGIEELRRNENIELHVIAPIGGLKYSSYKFSLEGVYYYFYNPYYTFYLDYFTRSYKLWNKLQTTSKYVRKFINAINPDIINLIGTENPYYSGSILDIFNDDIPIMVSLQTFFTNPDRLNFQPNVDRSVRWFISKSICEKCKYFGVTGRMHHDLLLNTNPSAISLHLEWCRKTLPEPIVTNKEFDFVNFAVHMSLKKGFHDSIQALALVKKKYPGVKLNLIGNCSVKIKNELISLINSLGLHENVIFTPFFQQQEEMFRHIQRSRFAVLPCKLDITSGTMSQAMFYELPLVVYKTSGTPRFNLKKESALIAPLNDVSALADYMLLLMDNPEKAEKLKRNAKEYITQQRDNKKAADQLIADYHAIIDHHYNQTPIPKELLFDTDNYPIYS